MGHLIQSASTRDYGKTQTRYSYHRASPAAFINVFANDFEITILLFITPNSGCGALTLLKTNQWKN